MGEHHTSTQNKSITLFLPLLHTLKPHSPSAQALAQHPPVPGHFPLFHSCHQNDGSTWQRHERNVGCNAMSPAKLYSGAKTPRGKIGDGAP